MVRGEPSTLFTKLENPLFFRHGAVLASSEYLLEAVRLVSERGGVTSIDRSTVEKLADCLNGGLTILGSGEVCDRGGGAGRRREF